MDILTASDYKSALKERVNELKRDGKPWSFRRLAEHLGLQATYLSRVMNQDSVHLSEEDLYSVGQALDFQKGDLDFLLLLRAHEVAKRADRRRDLAAKIEKIRAEKALSVETRGVQGLANKELEYVLNPLLVIFHLSLMAKALRRDPVAVGRKLGMQLPQIREALKTLEKMGLAKLDPEDPFKIIDVERFRTHYSKEHPLLKTALSLQRQLSQARIAVTPDEEKHVFTSTFTMDENGFQELKSEFQSFLKKAEEISRKSQHVGAYHLNFDLFRWV